MSSGALFQIFAASFLKVDVDLAVLHIQPVLDSGEIWLLSHLLVGPVSLFVWGGEGGGGMSVLFDG